MCKNYAENVKSSKILEEEEKMENQKPFALCKKLLEWTHNPIIYTLVTWVSG